MARFFLTPFDEQVARHVARREPKQSGRSNEDMRMVLAHTAGGLENGVGRRVDLGDAGQVVDRIANCG